MYEFLIKGNREGDLTIDSGDTILVNPAEKFVEVIGSVKRPAIYEIKDEWAGPIDMFGERKRKE